jgi:type I restriction enzyme S subunit
MELSQSVKSTEAGTIPIDWDAVSLSALCSIKSGEAITSESIDAYSDYPCYGGNGLRGFTPRFTHDGTRALIGRQGALCGNVLGVQGKFFASEHALVVTAKDVTDIGWLTFVLGRMGLNRYSESSAQPGLSAAKILRLEVACPSSKTEQTAIAKALSDADALIESLGQLLVKKRHLKQGAMQELLTGKKRLPGFAVKPGLKLTEAGAIPVDWGVSTIGVEFSVQLGKMLDAEKNVGVSRPFLGNRAVKWGRIDLADIGEVRLTASDVQRFRLRRGDLLVCEGGEVGRAAIWREPIEECYYQKALHRLRPSRGYSVEFMLHLLHRLAATGFLTNFVTQTSIAHLPKDKFETVPIPLPTSAEQAAIAAVLADMESDFVALEAKLTKARQIKQGMLQELLTGRIRLV